MDYRTALVTGASSGLGRGLALWFARKGVRVYAAARRSEELEALAAEARAAGGSVEPVVLDVSRTEEVLSRVRALDAACGGLDLVVANAGVGEATPARALEWEKVQRTIDVNVTGAAATLCAALPQMLERGRGHLVAVASLAGYRGLPGNAAYSASKAFLTTFTESLRVDLQGSGVRVTCLHPGFVKSAMTEKNRHPMPFLLETEAGVAHMAHAIEAGKREYAFPFPMRHALRLVKVLPNGLFDAIGRRVKR
ncbi:SDR family NAD(P)-dependent oxidoreductase [Aggregicoccus sp. 17bor-14]|uniref:SDR family NAD(P)-dependent oxidoreductase n=1 Tax=Myxococcaceae TaxID=31 RepID=UPI00129CC1D9|nr:MULTISPECIES: SDR family NAD(P)-dependent oxidoreductase [Myxococcaceae]MBF5044618.1 SDR family NAD(P)-dependent oxidoreductase [Simulacricoccus sp. 17bor-14]MRI90362.1 SDR family NAD(P)-dependent oxidoreductase [Aggregicoccus sp. 17bor-14]